MWDLGADGNMGWGCKFVAWDEVQKLDAEVRCSCRMLVQRQVVDV